MATQKELDAVHRLLDCPDLNLDELEDETRKAIEEARRVFITKLTQRHIDKYLAHRGNICPYCDSRNIANASKCQTDDMIAWQGVECHDCGEIWRDCYKLIDIMEV